MISSSISLVFRVILATVGSAVLVSCYTGGDDRSVDTQIVSAEFAGSSLRHVLEPWFGVTVDSVDDLSDIVNSPATLPVKPIARVVFDEFAPASEYVYAVNELHHASYIMGSLLDSHFMKQYDLEDYRNRIRDYLSAPGSKIDVWETGNEINGEWLGETTAVVAKMAAAFHQVEQAGGKTALTLYYNEGCWEDPSAEIFSWAGANIPDEVKLGVDYLLVSYYEDSCNDLQPDWPAVFQRLGEMFPQSKIGFGEIGTLHSDRKDAYIRRYYSMEIDHPRYISGYFWWYFKQDMVPNTKPLWQVLSDTIQS